LTDYTFVYVCVCMYIYIYAFVYTDHTDNEQWHSSYILATELRK